MTAYPALGDWGGKKPSEADPVRATMAELLAWSTLLTKAGGRVVVAPITVRPVGAAAATSSWQAAIAGGGATTAGAAAENGVRLERPVGKIQAVHLDGVALDTTLYRVDDGNLLVRTDGQSWPANQDTNAPVGGTGTFEVTYFRGWRPGVRFIWAVGQLAAEFYAALGGKKCRLPDGVTSVVRQGVTYEIANRFDAAGTGIREVDAVLALYNPHGRRMKTVIASPESLAAKPREIARPELLPIPGAKAVAALHLVQGADTAFVARYLTGSPAAGVDLTGWSARAQIRAAQGGALWLELVDEIDLAADGTVTVVVPHEATEGAAWNGRTYGVWDLELTRPDGTRIRFIEGAVTVSHEVTQ